eukprot:6601578-Pyramimonas_sp.AAC.1
MPVILSTSHLVGRRVMTNDIRHLGLDAWSDLDHVEVLFFEYDDAGPDHFSGFCLSLGAFTKDP